MLRFPKLTSSTKNYPIYLHQLCQFTAACLTVNHWPVPVHCSQTMASAFCRGCLSRLPRASFLPPPPTVPRTTTTATAAAATAGFHTSAVHYANPTKKSNSLDSGPKYRQAKSAKMKRKKPVERTRPPPIGERKALRNRIVLGNPNALEPTDMQNISVENMGDPRVRGSVVGLPVSMLEQLRSVHAFKKSQGWGLFRRPATFMRKEALEMGRLFEKISGEEQGKVVKKVITGKVGSGKSVFLTQAMAMGFLKNWVVFTVPESEYSSCFFGDMQAD